MNVQTGVAWEHLQHLVSDGEMLSLDVFLPAIGRPCSVLGYGSVPWMRSPFENLKARFLQGATKWDPDGRP